jgi:hypothetical protein
MNVHPEARKRRKIVRSEKRRVMGRAKDGHAFAVSVINL